LNFGEEKRMDKIIKLIGYGIIILISIITTLAAVIFADLLILY
jgi:hypothetical protein